MFIASRLDWTLPVTRGWSGNPVIGAAFVPGECLLLCRFFGVRRETGKEQSVKVPYGEGVATRIGAEPCADVRNLRGSPLTVCLHTKSPEFQENVH